MRKKLLSAFIFVILAILPISILNCGGAEEGSVDLKSETDKVSYSIGAQLGMNFKDMEAEINPDIVKRAINDVMSGSKTALTEEEMEQVMQKFVTDMRAEQEAKMMQEANANLAEASAFLAENAKKTGITTLADSLQYSVMKEGGGATAKDGDTVKVNYRGTLLDGTEFDSSYDREPFELTIGQGVIPGWSEILKHMKVGDQWKVFIPPQLAYGPRANAAIPANSLLIFEMELVEIVK